MRFGAGNRIGKAPLVVLIFERDHVFGVDEAAFAQAQDRRDVNHAIVFIVRFAGEMRTALQLRARLVMSALVGST